MFKSRVEVDRHVENCLKKIHGETERNLRCLAFAKLYYKVGDYEQTRRYVSTYLSAKPCSAEGQLLLGKAWDMLGKKESALEAFRTSLDLDPKQNNVLIKICELLAADVNLDQACARYYCDKAQSIDPHNPVILSLKEHLISTTSKDPNEVSKLLIKELEMRPTDINVRIRLLRHLLQSSEIKEAYRHVREIEQKNLMECCNNLGWYETVAKVLLQYQRENIGLTWEFWMLLTSTLDKLVLLSLDEHAVNIKTSAECVSNLFNYDQALKTTAENVKSCPDKQLAREFLNHYRGQLCLHLATIMFKLAKVNSLKYKEVTQITLPLLLIAYHTQPPELRCMWLDHAPETTRCQLQRWHREACFRCSQAGHVLLAANKDQKASFLEKATLESSGYWQEKVFKKIFISREHQSKITNSFFATSSELGETIIRLPELSDLKTYDEHSQLLHPDSLHYHIWIGINQNLPNFRCSLFDGLQYSVRNLSNCSAESLNVLDIHSFIYASILCAQSQIEDSKHNIYSSPNKPNILPAAITDTLGTLNQAKWLLAAWKMYRNDYSSNFGETRLILIRGIEVVRSVGSHGMDVKLLVLLARIFAERAQNLTKQSEVEFNNARAEIYWKAALPLLEKLKSNQAISYASNRLFHYEAKEMSINEVVSHIESGKLFNAVQLMKKKEHEKALQIFETLKDPYASFYQAQIYKNLAEEQTSSNKESVTSEMRSQHITLLSHVRDYLYLTLDRLRDPLVDKKHPLNAQLGGEIEKIERLLSRIDPDISNRECDGMSDENSSYSSIPDHGFPNISYTNGISPKQDALLRLDNSHRREARPSPERLDAQLRQLAASKDAAINNILEYNKVMVDSHRNLVEELRSFKEVVANLTTTVNDLKTIKHTVDELKGIKQSVDELKASVDDLQNLRNVTDVVYEMKKELAELKKDANKLKTNQLSDEDLYALDEEYSDYATINSNVSNLNTTLYSNFQQRLQPTAGTLGYGAHPLYPGLGMAYPYPYPYAGIGLAAQPGALPFAQEAQLADLRAINALSQGISQTGLPQAMPHCALPNTLLAQTNLNPVPHHLLPAQGLPKPTNLFKDPGTPTSHMNNSHNLLPSMPTITPTAPIAAASPSAALASCKAPPVNVVITSSDPLPTTNTVTAPILSVTIPPQHLKGNIQKMLPHNYQIPLPPGATVSAPSVMNQSPLPVSTKGLLSNVAAPLYSAIPDKKSPVKSVGLGFQIEKSLSQSFNNTNNSMDMNKSNASTTSVEAEEHDPCPDFKPIIPLPDEVPVNTGEEKELVLFCERAKLFRFADKEKEWRERGVGDFKILQNDDTGKIRILMRRDQVHKICANHFITSDLVLTPMPKSDRAYVWAANDFADEAFVLEKLCVRFKTPVEAKKFHDAFESAKNTISNVSSKLSDERANALDLTRTPQPVSSLGGFVFTGTPTFKPKNLDETIPIVSQQEPIKTSPFASFSFGNISVSVDANKPVERKALFVENVINTELSKPAENPVFNFFSSKPAAAATIPSENTGNSLFSSSPIISAAVSKPGDKPTFANSLRASHKSSNVAHSALSSIQDGGGDADGDAEEFVPTVEFKPVIPLPELVELKTGEENAEVLFEHKAKLLRYDSSVKEWKERGVGIMKILKQDNTIRFLMRREQVHKVCCNHQLFKEMSFTKMDKNPKAVTWCAKDFSEGEIITEMFALRFKTEDITNSFLAAIAKAQITLNASNVVDNAERPRKKSDKKSKPDDTPPVKGFSDKFKPKAGSWECKNCYILNDGKENYCLACETPKNDTVPKKTVASGPQFSFGVPKSDVSTVTNQSPAISVSFTPKKDVIPKKDDKPAVTFGFTSVTSANSPTSGFGDAFKVKIGSWECSCCYIRNDADSSECMSCENPKDGSVPKKETSKGLNLETPGLKFNFGIPAAPVTTKAEVSFSFGTNVTPSNPGFVFNTPDSTTDDTPINLTSNKFSFKMTADEKAAEPKISAQDESSDKFVFGSPQKHGFEFTPRSPRRISGGQNEEESDGSYVEEEADNIYFKPLIPLPDKVEVLTGEENENVLYCHRAKLFRFKDSEWKERGIGDIKILCKADTGKLRVLMRREKVLKICLNHVLTPDVEYRPKDDKTWLFAAPDFSECEIQHEQFCLRFKAAEIAKEFKTAVDNALQKHPSGDETIPTDSDSEVEFVSETTVTPEEEKEAIRLGLPPKFFAYRQLPDCTCEQCKKDDTYMKETTNTKPMFAPSFGALKSESVTPTNGSSSSSSLILTPKKPGNVFEVQHQPTIFASAIFATTTASSTNIFSTNTVASSKSATTPIIFGDGIKVTPVVTNIFGQPASSPIGNKTTAGSFFGTSISSNTPLSASSSTASFFNTTTTPTSIFDKTSSTTFNSASTGSLFGNPTSVAKTASTGSIFGNATMPVINTVPTGSLFGNPIPPVKVATTGSIFGNHPSATLNTSSASIFGNAVSTSFNSSTNSIFETPPTTVFGMKVSPFGVNSGPVFGSYSATVPDANKSIFGSNIVSPTFGSLAEGTGDAPKMNSSVNLENELVLKSDSNLTFAALVANNTVGTPTFAKCKDDDKNPFASLGAGTPVFGSKSTRKSPQKKDKTQSGDEGDDATEDYDPHYEPIVPLPQAIVVSTGEEEETALFNERSKLFRYDGKEWKERGVGQLKVLHHPVKNTYRLLLRREQVHKLVLNQLLTPELNMQPMTTSDKEWLWGGYNYAEDEGVLEKLAARFKNTDMAKKFFDVVQDCISKLREQQESRSIPISVQNIGVVDVSDAEEQGSEEDLEEEEDYEDDRSVMFMKTCIFSEQLPTGVWKEYGSRDIQIFYDAELYGSRISVNDDSGLVVSNTLIGINTIMNKDGLNCTWRAVEWADHIFQWKTLRATFDNLASVEEFYLCYEEGVGYAQQCEIVDEIPTFTETE